jgi:hypothetical protein
MTATSIQSPDSIPAFDITNPNPKPPIITYTSTLRLNLLIQAFSDQLVFNDIPYRRTKLRPVSLHTPEQPTDWGPCRESMNTAGLSVFLSSDGRRPALSSSSSRLNPPPDSSLWVIS